MRIRNGLVKALAFIIGSILVLASNGPRRMLAQRNKPSDAQQQTRPKREAQPKTEPATVSNKPIAQGDVDFERPLTLPAIIGNLDENLPDTDDPRPGRTHQPRAPGGPGRGGNGGGDQPGGRTTPVVLPAATVFGKQIKMGNDPMVAVGENFVVATQAHAIYFYDKQSGRAITPPQPKLEFTSNRCGQTAETGGMCMEQFFAPFFAPFLNDNNGKPDRSRPNPQDINRHLAKLNLQVDPLHLLDPSSIDKLKKMVCDPDNPTASGCVNEGYDTRVIYDKEHKRFWVESNLRNPIFGSGDESPNHIVVPDWTHLHQRFTAVAVSKSEDPRDGFHEYVLSDHPGDWPTIGVHGSFLIIGAHGRKDVHLFDAAKLRNGNDAFDLVHLGSYSDSDFDSDAVWPVIQHDNRGGTQFIPTVPATPSGSDNVPTFLVGTGGGDKITIYAFDTPKKLIDQPSVEFLAPQLVSSTIHLNHDVSSIIATPVYRNGFIYLTWEECVDGGNWGDICNRQVRVVQIPVFRVTGLNRILASTDSGLGFHDYVFGGDTPQLGTLTSYDIPALDVNRNDDVAIVYGRAGPSPLLARPGAFYAISYHDQRGLVLDGVLREAQCSPPGKLDCIHLGQGDTHLDLSCVVIDPTDETTAWMAHEFVEGKIRGFEMVIGRVRP